MGYTILLNFKFYLIEVFNFKIDCVIRNSIYHLYCFNIVKNKIKQNQGA